MLNVALMELDRNGTGNPRERRQDGRASQEVPQVRVFRSFYAVFRSFYAVFVLKMIALQGLTNEGDAVAAGDAVYFDTGRNSRKCTLMDSVTM